MASGFSIQPIGAVRLAGEAARIEIFAPFREGLLGLEGFSHILVLYWFHEHDTPACRRTLRVHPRNDPANPLTGVFATHSPRRPNLIGLTRCRITALFPDGIGIEAIDARDGSPVIDIKCAIPEADPPGGLRVPAWVGRR
jgi:tRNA-Thr(GGU) m(6)t(6)A37 methyltransferase TsaA